MLTTPTSRWTAAAAAGCAGLVAVTYLAVVGPKRGEASDLADAAVTAEQQNDMLQVRTAQLRAQSATLPQRQAELSALIGQLPVTADVPHFVRSLDTMAASAGVGLQTVTPGAAQYLDAVDGSAGGGTAAASTDTGTPATSGGSGGSGARVVAVPMTIAVHGPYFKTVTFLKQLQSGDRAFLVTGLQAAVDAGQVTLTIKGRVFAVPGAAQALSAAAAAGTRAGDTGTTAATGTTPAPTPTATGGPAAVPSPSPSR